MQARPETVAPATAPHARPRSEAQRAAARTNGARSRGPVSAEGKARSSRNAFRHGLCSPAILAPGEDPAAFAALLAELRAEHAPRTASEALLVERLAVAFWKLARCDRLEATLATIEPHCPTGRLFPDPGLPRLLSRVPELNAVLRHQAQLQREVHRLLRTLAERAAAAPSDRPDHDPAAEPSDDARGDPFDGPADAPDDEDLRNEPEPTSPAAARGPVSFVPPADPVGPPGPVAADPASTTEPPAEPGPGLLDRARSDPALARTIEDQLLANGDLRGFERARRALDRPSDRDDPTNGNPA